MAHHGVPWCHLEGSGLPVCRIGRLPFRLETRRGSPVDDRPSTDKLHHFVQKKKKKKMARDTWHMTCDTWHMTHLGGWTFSQNFSSLALTVCDLWYYEDILGKGWVTQLMNHKAVCRTAPATPGLSNTTWDHSKPKIGPSKFGIIKEDLSIIRYCLTR